MDSWSLLFDIVILLFGCVAAGGLASRFGQSPIVGYLLAGMILGGPGSIYLVRSKEELEIVAELGISLLLFSLGLEFSWSKLKSLGVSLLVAGFFQVIITLIGCATILASLGFSISESLGFGAMIAVSSTACVLRILADRAETDSPNGRNSIAILLVQDIAIVPLAILITMLGSDGDTNEVLTSLAEITGFFLALALGLYIIVSLVAVKILSLLTLQRNRELSVTLGIAIGLGSTWLAHEAGLSPALGAFLAGMFLGGSPFATQVRADVAPLRVLLLTLFFGSAGMVADPFWIYQNFILVTSTTISIMLGKALVVVLLMLFIKRPLSLSFATAITLSQIGEFAFVLGALGSKQGVINEETYMLIVSSAIVSMLLTPILVSNAPQIGLYLARLISRSSNLDMPLDISKRHPEIVVIGFGPSGKIAAAAFCEFGKKLLVIDLNPAAKKSAKEDGYSVLVGDVALFEFLEHANVNKAKLFIITIPHHVSALKAIDHIRKLAPDGIIVVRARHQIEEEALWAAGAHIVVGDEEEVGKMLADRALNLFVDGD